MSDLTAFPILSRESARALKWLTDATTDEGGAFDLTCVKVNGCAVATDGRRIHAVPESLIPPALPKGTVRLEGVKITATTATAESVKDEFPPLGHIIPPAGTPYQFRIMLRPSLLKSILEGFDPEDGVEIRFRDAQRGAEFFGKAKGCHTPIYAMLMPMRFDPESQNEPWRPAV